MTTITYNAPRNNFPLKSVFLLVLAAISIAFAWAVQLNLHAVASHGSETERVDQRCNSNSLGIWDVGHDKHYQICSMEDGSYGIRVLIKNADNTFRKVTSFIRKTHGKPVTDIVKVQEYLGVRGIPPTIP